MTYRFYKTPEDRWFIDIPEWPRDLIDSLEMVAGADKMLDMLLEFSAPTEREIALRVYDDDPGEAEYGLPPDAVLELESASDDGFSGANYQCRTVVDLKGFPAWLCNVTEYVFGKFPKKIYIYL